jgi:hypothetical protein
VLSFLLLFKEFPCVRSRRFSLVIFNWTGCLNAMGLAVSCADPTAIWSCTDGTTNSEAGSNAVCSYQALPIAANNAESRRNIKDQCLAGWYNSNAGRGIDFVSLLGLVPGWSPNATENFREIATLGAVKYGGLLGMAKAANKWDVVTIQTINSTTTIGSSAGAGLSVGLKWFGKLAGLGTFYATGLDVLAHAGCATVARQQTAR